MWAPIIAAIISALIPLLNDLLKKWLEGRLNEAAVKLGVTPGAFERADLALFRFAHATTPWYMFSRKRKLGQLLKEYERVSTVSIRPDGSR